MPQPGRSSCAAPSSPSSSAPRWQQAEPWRSPRRPTHSPDGRTTRCRSPTPSSTRRASRTAEPPSPRSSSGRPTAPRPDAGDGRVPGPPVGLHGVRRRQCGHHRLRGGTGRRPVAARGIARADPGSPPRGVGDMAAPRLRRAPRPDAVRMGPALRGLAHDDVPRMEDPRLPTRRQARRARLRAAQLAGDRRRTTGSGVDAHRVSFDEWSEAGRPTPGTVAAFPGDRYCSVPGSAEIRYVGIAEPIGLALSFERWIAAGSPQASGSC